MDNQIFYYGLWDLQVHRYLQTGLNSRNKEDLKEAFLNYISVDFDDEDTEEVFRKLSIEELAEMKEFRIETQTEPFEEEEY